MILLCGALALAGCKAKKQIIVNREPVAVTQPVPTTVKAAPTVNAKLVAIQQKQATFNTFNGKAKARLVIDNDDNDVTLNIRIDRDKKIWVSVVAQVILSIEVARVMITPDSIIIVNKLQGVYTKKPFSYVYQYAGNQVSFKSLQALLIGNAMPELLNDRAEVSTDGANTIIAGLLQDLNYKLTIGADYKVSQTNLANNLAALTLQVNNSAFINADGRIIPSQIDIVSQAGAKKINISLHYNTAEFDKVLEYPFSIPDRYTPVN